MEWHASLIFYCITKSVNYRVMKALFFYLYNGEAAYYSG